MREWALKDGVMNATYEIFCADPLHLVDQLAKTIPTFNSVRIDSRICVKESDRVRLRNLNTRIVAKLNPDEIDAIATIVAADRDLLSFFGYQAELAQ